MSSTHDEVTISKNVTNPADHRTGCTLKSPYDKQFIGELKALVGRQDYAWLDKAQVWWFAQQHCDRMIKLCLKYFSEVTINTGKIGEADQVITRHGTFAQERLL